MNTSCPSYEDLKRLSEELGRPVETLIVLTRQNDPFFAGMPSNQAGAEWFAKLWREYGVGRARHIRRVHYILQAQPHGTVRMLNGAPYENTDECWKPLAVASKYARYLDLIERDALVDRRNPDPLIFWRYPGRTTGSVWAGMGGAWSVETPEFPEFPYPPALYIEEPPCIRPVMVEIWVEKSGDLDDVLIPICQSRHVNLIPCRGEQGNEACQKVAERAVEAQCPVRILYLSDFDPAGQSMPVAVARKIEFEIRKRELDVHIQLRPIGLTHEQCIQYRLPRTPIKASEHRGARFEERFGEGATELDALEALHPGELGRIVEREVARYQSVDPEIKRQFREVYRDLRSELDEAEATVLARHEDALDELRDEYDRLREEHDRVLAELAEWSRRIGSLHGEIRDQLVEEQPDLSEFEWPDPSEPDEDPDPLFDARRSYLDQIDRFKRHQGKRTEKRPGRWEKANGGGAEP